MRLHARVQKVEEGRHALAEAFWALVEKHDLTYLEWIKCITTLIDDMVRYGIRDERHPNSPNKKGDEA